LTFSRPPRLAMHLCWSCGGCLTFHGPQTAVNRKDRGIDLAQKAYLAALDRVDADARLLGRTIDQAFRKFADDVLTVLTRSLNPSPRSHRASMVGRVAREDLVQIIAELVLNSTPSRDIGLRTGYAQNWDTAN
jgi:hypothetical protein